MTEFGKDLLVKGIVLKTPQNDLVIFNLKFRLTFKLVG